MLACSSARLQLFAELRLVHISGAVPIGGPVRAHGCLVPMSSVLTVGDFSVISVLYYYNIAMI